MTAQLVAEKPTIKILLYTDDPRSITDGTKLLGLSSMIERLQAHAPTFADLSIKWVSRSSRNDIHADNRLNLVLEREVAETQVPFDEIWFFGLHQANTESERIPLGISRGGPNSELDEAETEALRRWMEINDDGTGGGGVLMTGDHNNRAPANRLPGRNGSPVITNDTLLGLGRALGGSVPRAGELRRWIGPPSALRDDSFSTIASTGFQTDRIPQKLKHQRFNAAGAPDPTGKEHPLFYYRGDELITVFPDHAHEGALIIPDVSDPNVWPGGSGKPIPQVIAFGEDRVHGRQVDLLTAYDGDAAGVGRIVADSSWHHYLNINLAGFPHPAPVPSESDMIGQFYGNLAVWLAPLHKRRQMAKAMAWELTEFTRLVEDAEDRDELGEISDLILRRAAAPCEIHELMKALAPPQFTSMSFWEGRDLTSTAILQKEVLGSVLWSYHEAITQAENAATELSALDATTVINQGFARAFGTGTDSSSFANSTTNTDPRVEERSNEMGCTGEEEREWTIAIRSDSGVNSIPSPLIFCLNDQGGVVTGKVSDAVERTILSAVAGTHSLIFDSNSIGFMSLAFNVNGSFVLMEGATLMESETTTRFDGRFRTFAPSATNCNGTATDLGEIPAVTFGTGDTGTGTGTTT